MKDKPLRYSRWLVESQQNQKSPIRRCFKSRPPLRTRCAGSPPAASHGCKDMKSPSTASLERDAGLLSSVTDLKRPSASSSLGGCPASCPDTYRLTHDHRHVRNWARVHISGLSLLCNIFFQQQTVFFTTSFSRHKRARRT